MKTITSINIKEIIIHVLDPIRNNEPGKHAGLVLSYKPLDLGEESVVRSYFQTHIIKSLTNPKSKAAAFKHIAEPEISGVCKGLINGTSDFIQGSQKIARELYSILDKDARTKAADLAIAIFKASNFEDQFLAIMKIDPSRVYQHQVKQINGEQFVDFQEFAEAFTDKELQKAAFIRILDEEKRHLEYDMVLLDRAEDIAQYFKDKLLGAEESYTAEQRTWRVYSEIVDVTNDLRGILTSEELEKFQIQKDALITSREVNIDNWIKQLDIPDKGRNVVKEKLQSFPDREFLLDPQLGQKISSRVIIEGDRNFRLTFARLYYDQIIKSIKPIMKDGKQMGSEVTLHVLGWHEVAR